MLISGHIYILTICVYIGVVNSGRHASPHIRKSSLDHDSGESVPFCLDCSVPWVYAINFKRKKEKKNDALSQKIDT